MVMETMAMIMGMGKTMERNHPNPIRMSYQLS